MGEETVVAPDLLVRQIVAVLRRHGLHASSSSGDGPGDLWTAATELATRLAAAEKVVEAARPFHVQGHLHVLVTTASDADDIRALTNALDAYDALSAPPTGRGAEG